jgi:hypothetical protein
MSKGQKISQLSAVAGLVKVSSGTIQTATAGTDFAAATSTTNILKGNGLGGFSSATAGTDYLTPSGSETITNKLLSGVNRNTHQTLASAAGGTINVSLLTDTTWYYTLNATSNITFNFRGSAGTALNSTLAVGESVVVRCYITNGATPYYPTGHQIDGSTLNVTIKWLSSVLSAGNANSIDLYTYTIMKTAATPAYTIFASQTKFV